jgi:hypothetical protein
VIGDLMFAADTPGQSFSAAPDSAGAIVRAQFDVSSFVILV